MTAVKDVDDLRARVTAGQYEFAIMLGVGYSRKSIHWKTKRWEITNHIDGSRQRLTDEELSTESNIGIALERGALKPMKDDYVRMADGTYKKFEKLLSDAHEVYEARVAELNTDPLKYIIESAPGSIRMGEGEGDEWEPADPKLLLEICDIGPVTVAQIDLAAVGMFDADDGTAKSATTSIELTIEDIDGLIATLGRIKDDAIATRNFALRKSGFWTNGIDEEDTEF